MLCFGCESFCLCVGCVGRVEVQASQFSVSSVQICCRPRHAHPPHAPPNTQPHTHPATHRRQQGRIIEDSELILRRFSPLWCLPSLVVQAAAHRFVIIIIAAPSCQGAVLLPRLPRQLKYVVATHIKARPSRNHVEVSRPHPTRHVSRMPACFHPPLPPLSHPSSYMPTPTHPPPPRNSHA